MGYTSEVDIMNSALRKVGAERIVTANDNNSRARLVKDAYPHVRDYYLRAHPWKFSTHYISLAAIDPKPADVYDYDYVFQLPADCLRVIGVDGGDDKWSEISGQRIVSDEATITVKYIKLITDVTKWDVNFGEVVATAVALDICYTLTQSASMVDKLESKLEKLIRETRSFSAQVGSQKQVGASAWIDARRS